MSCGQLFFNFGVSFWKVKRNYIWFVFLADIMTSDLISKRDSTALLIGIYELLLIVNNYSLPSKWNKVPAKERRM